MQKRVTGASSGRQKRQVRTLQKRFESQGVPLTEARSRAQAKAGRLGHAGAQQGGRIISKKVESAQIAQRPKSKKGIRVQGGTVALPRRITTKRAEAVTSGQVSRYRKRSTKARK